MNDDDADDGVLRVPAATAVAATGVDFVSFNGVDVWNAGFDALDFDALKLLVIFSLFDVRFFNNFEFLGVFIRFSQENRRFGTFDLASRCSGNGHVYDFSSLNLDSLSSAIREKQKKKNVYFSFVYNLNITQ